MEVQRTWDVEEGGFQRHRRQSRAGMEIQGAEDVEEGGDGGLEGLGCAGGR